LLPGRWKRPGGGGGWGRDAGARARFTSFNRIIGVVLRTRKAVCISKFRVREREVAGVAAGRSTGRAREIVCRHVTLAGVPGIVGGAHARSSLAPKGVQRRLFHLRLKQPWYRIRVVAARRTTDDAGQTQRVTFTTPPHTPSRLTPPGPPEPTTNKRPPLKATVSVSDPAPPIKTRKLTRQRHNNACKCISSRTHAAPQQEHSAPVTVIRRDMSSQPCKESLIDGDRQIAQPKRAPTFPSRRIEALLPTHGDSILRRRSRETVARRPTSDNYLEMGAPGCSRYNGQH